MVHETNAVNTPENEKSLNFIEQFVEEDLKNNKNAKRIHTRFPPEPNGYLHIGHAKAICLDFGIAAKYGGKCNLRFDDTNPAKEDVEYVESIQEDIKWLGFDWENRLYYTSDYFQRLYDFAVDLIKRGLAYVDEQSADEIANQKGTPTEAGTASPFRERPVAESLDLFERMNRGEFEEGAMILRAKIDMASPNMHMRDPIIYRIINAPHHRTGDAWHVYPMYDFAHGQSDYFEGITHSLCTLEFEVHRPLYDWFIDKLQSDDYGPRQIEFNRLNLTYTVMSKRKLHQLVEEGHVNGWDDPRLPTLSGLRRRGYTPASIKNFVDRIGYTKYEAMNDVGLLEHAIREDLNKHAPRLMAVLNPVKLIIDNLADDHLEYVSVENNPENPDGGHREMEFAKELYIERDDFMEDAPKKFFRMTPGREVRLKGAYIVMCTGVDKDNEGNITAIHCTYDPDSKSGSGSEASKRKVKGTLHWVSAQHAIDGEVRLYDRLFTDAEPDSHEGKDFKDFINPDSLKIVENCKLESNFKHVKAQETFQFTRLGYFVVDSDSSDSKLVFNRTVTLKDSWAKIKRK